MPRDLSLRARPRYGATCFLFALPADVGRALHLLEDDADVHVTRFIARDHLVALQLQSLRFPSAWHGLPVRMLAHYDGRPGIRCFQLRDRWPCRPLRLQPRNVHAMDS